MAIITAYPVVMALEQLADILCRQDVTFATLFRLT